MAGYRALFVSDIGVSELILQLTEIDSSLDGSEFMCVAIGTDGRRHETSITIRAKGTHERMQILLLRELIMV